MMRSVIPSSMTVLTSTRSDAAADRGEIPVRGQRPAGPDLPVAAAAQGAIDEGAIADGDAWSGVLWVKRSW